MLKTPTEYAIKIWDLMNPNATADLGPNSGRYVQVAGKRIHVGENITFGREGQLLIQSTSRDFRYVSRQQGIFTLRAEDQQNFPGIIYRNIGKASVRPVFKLDGARGREANLRGGEDTRIYSGEGFRILDHLGREALEVGIQEVNPSGTRFIERSL
jgi:hypothetical protein